MAVRDGDLCTCQVHMGMSSDENVKFEIWDPKHTTSELNPIRDETVLTEMQRSGRLHRRWWSAGLSKQSRSASGNEHCTLHQPRGSQAAPFSFQHVALVINSSCI
jgi:hypothetical protein